MQSAATIDRFRPPIVIRALNRFGAMLNGQVSRRIAPEDLIEIAKRRANLDDFGEGVIFANRLPACLSRAGGTRA